MRFEHGTYRTALIVGGLVFKFPHVKGIIRASYARGYFYRGIMMNLSEYFLYLLLKEHQSFLAPVYFSIGIISVQRYEEGAIPQPGDEHYEGVWNNLSRAAKDHLMTMDGHALDYHNWRKSSTGLRLIDYGDKLGDVSPVSGFLTRWHRELDSALKNK